MRLASIAWRGLLARPLRTALAVIGIALGVAVVSLQAVRQADRLRRDAGRRLVRRQVVRARGIEPCDQLRPVQEDGGDLLGHGSRSGQAAKDRQEE